MLSITKKSGYGLVAMTRLATLANDEVISAREIAEHFDVPVSLLMNVLKELAAAGFVESVRGARGGYRLARPAEEITLRDLIVALEGPIRLAECVRGEQGNSADHRCRIIDRCPIADPVHRVNRKISDFLTEIRLTDLLGAKGVPSAGQ